MSFKVIFAFLYPFKYDDFGPDKFTAIIVHFFLNNTSLSLNLLPLEGNYFSGDGRDEERDCDDGIMKCLFLL